MTTLLRLAAVKDRTGLSRSAIYAMLDDGSFPRPVKLSERLNAWPDEEVEDWIRARIRGREHT